MFRKAQKSLEEQEEWTLASSLFGVDTFYRREEDGSLSLKLQGEVSDIPLFEQVCVLREVDLHYKWAPFCSSSFTVADLDKLDTVGWFLIGLSSFGLARDGCFRAIGCDNIQEDGSILLAGQGIQDLPENAPEPEETYLCNDPIIQQLKIPPKPTRRGADRMTIRTFDAVIHVTSPTSATTKIVANIDPNISFLPQSLLEFIMKHLAGVLLAKLQSAAKKVVKHPLHNEHAKKMRQEEDFYKSWLMAKFQAVCDLRGWSMPPVNAFTLTPEQLRKEKASANISAVNDAERNLPSEKMPPARMTRSASFVGEPGFDGSDVDQYTEYVHHTDHGTHHGSGVIELSPTSSRLSGKQQQHLDNNDDHSAEDDEEDLVSELTSISGRSWHNKPIRTFLQKREQKKAAKKRADIRAVRTMAANRILPKQRSPSQRVRLEQLRGAKAQRLGGGSLTMVEVPDLSRDDGEASNNKPLADEDDAPSTTDHTNTSRGVAGDAMSIMSAGDGTVTTLGGGTTTTTATTHYYHRGVAQRRKKSFSERITDRLQAHGKMKRFLVMSLVFSLLFLLLNPELVEVLLVGPDRSVLPWTKTKMPLIRASQFGETNNNTSIPNTAATNSTISPTNKNINSTEEDMKQEGTTDPSVAANSGEALSEQEAVGSAETTFSVSANNNEEENKDKPDPSSVESNSSDAFSAEAVAQMPSSWLPASVLQRVQSAVEALSGQEAVGSTETTSTVSVNSNEEENKDKPDPSSVESNSSDVFSAEAAAKVVAQMPSSWLPASVLHWIQSAVGIIQIIVVNGVGLLFYLSLCSITHFFTCDIALVYAFNALDLGSKAGRQVKKYYSENVRVVVAAMSLGIYVVSVTKALSRIALSATVWLVSHRKQLFEVCRPILEYLGMSKSDITLRNIIQNMTEMLEETMGAFEGDDWEDATLVRGAANDDNTSWSAGAILRILQSASTLVLKWVGPILMSAFTLVWKLFLPILQSASTLVWKWVGPVTSLVHGIVNASGSGVVVELDEALDTWQADAFETARIFFSYSSVPLLIFLVLFNYSAGWARRAHSNRESSPKRKKIDDQSKVTSATEATNDTPSAEHLHGNNNKKLPTTPRRLFDEAMGTIVNKGKLANNNLVDDQEQEGSANSPGMSTSQHSRRDQRRRRQLSKSSSDPGPDQNQRQQRRRMRFLQWSPKSDLGVVQESSAEMEQ